MLFFFTGHLLIYSQIINNRILENFQRNLVVEKHAGSNIILIHKDNQVFIIKSRTQTPGDKDITKKVFSPFGQCQSRSQLWQY